MNLSYKGEKRVKKIFASLAVVARANLSLDMAQGGENL
jgi:hypothetical protein